MQSLAVAFESRPWVLDDLATFASCRRQFEYSFVEGRPVGLEPIEAFTDARVREAIFGYLRQARDGRPPGERLFIETFQQRWRDRLGPTVRIVRAGDRVEAFAHRAELMLRRFHAAWPSDAPASIEAVDHRVRITVRGTHALSLAVDLVAYDRARLLTVTTFTTGLRPGCDAEHETMRLEASGTAALVEWKADLVRLVHHTLPDGHSRGEPFSRADAVRHVGRLARRLDEASSSTIFPVSRSIQCAWCGFRETCHESGFPSGFVPLGEGAGAGCPRCRSGLGVRHGRAGVFISCSDYPDCRYTRDL